MRLSIKVRPTRASVIVAAMCCAGLIAGGGLSPASADDDLGRIALMEDAARPFLDDPSIDFARSLAEAEAQQRAASLATTIADRYPNQFSLLVHHADGTSTIHMVGGVPADVSRLVSADRGVVTQGGAAYSETQADELMAAVHYAMVDSLQSTDILTTADNVTGEITVATKDPADALDLLDGARDSLRSARGNNDGFASHMAEAAATAGVDDTLLLDRVVIKHDPTLLFEEQSINGGDLLTLYNTTTPWCTAAFPAKDAGGKAGLTTAEHCTNKIVDGKSVNRPLTVDGGKKLINPPYAKMSRSHGDAAYLRSNNVTVNPRFRYDWGSYRNVWAHPVLGEGTKVCRFGRTTGTGSGCTKVKYVSACYSVYCGLATTTAWTRDDGGDSGGPWYHGNNAYGIHSGSGTRDGVRVNYFTNSRKALQKMALTAMTKR